MRYWIAIAVAFILLFLLEGLFNIMTKIGVTLAHWVLSRKRDTRVPKGERVDGDETHLPQQTKHENWTMQGWIET